MSRFQSNDPPTFQEETKHELESEYELARGQRLLLRQPIMAAGLTEWQAPPGVLLLHTFYAGVARSRSGSSSFTALALNKPSSSSFSSSSSSSSSHICANMSVTSFLLLKKCLLLNE